ncbi:MAG: response regulator, partial [Gammaproteobacteria bacterium]|nr:response regulator [Gammaproteobacteria bacterium]
FISQNLAALMKGRIDAISEEGKGSTFELTLPYQQSDIAIRKQSSNQDKVVLDQKFLGHVLVAEDTPLLQQLERRILESLEVTVTIAENGQEAVELAMDLHFDLILMDMQMPIMSGIEATKLLRERGSHTPIVAVTANVMQKHREEFDEAGCDDFLAKPFQNEELLRVLQQYLTQK